MAKRPLPMLAALPLRRLLARAGALLLPGECALCGGNAGGRLVCGPCHRQYINDATGPVAPARCRSCANLLPPRSPGRCAQCLLALPAFDATVAVADYALPLDRLVLQLKFGGRLALARLFGDALADLVAATVAATVTDMAADTLVADGVATPSAVTNARDHAVANGLAAGAANGEAASRLVLPDVLLPVPLAPRRLAERGYNQALEIARPLARRLALPLQAGLAIRARETAALAGAATPAERRAHIAGAFAVPRRSAIEGRHIGLVDDVMTSGATMNELAALLKRHGAARVTCFVFARTPPHDL